MDVVAGAQRTLGRLKTGGVPPKSPATIFLSLWPSVFWDFGSLFRTLRRHFLTRCCGSRIFVHVVAATSASCHGTSQQSIILQMFLQLQMLRRHVLRLVAAVLALRSGVLLLEEYFESSRLHKSPWRIYLALSLSTSRNRVPHHEIIHWLSKQTVSHSEREQAFRSRRSCRCRPQSGIGLHSLVSGVLSANSTARQLSNDLSLERSESRVLATFGVGYSNVHVFTPVAVGSVVLPLLCGAARPCSKGLAFAGRLPSSSQTETSSLLAPCASVARKCFSSPVSSISVTVTSARPCSPKETCSLLAPNVPLRFREGDCPRCHTRHALSLLYFTTQQN